MSKPLILCIAQDDALSGDVKRALNGSVFRLQFCQTPAGALTVAHNEPVSAFLVDYALVPDPGALINVLREAAPAAAVMAMCPAALAERAVESLALGQIGGLLLQPLPPDAALRAVYRCVAMAVLDRLSRSLPDAADRLLKLGERPAIMALLRELLVEGELAPCASIASDLRTTASPWQKELFRDDDLRIRLDASLTLLLRLAGSAMIRLNACGDTESEYDVLTGVFNKLGFRKSLEREIERCERYGSNLVIMMLDLDRFTELNTVHGRQVGDRVLKGLGNVLDGLTRRTDIIARLDNDEFCLLLPGLDLRGAIQAARRFQREIDTWSQAALHGVPVSLSCGLALYEKGDSHAELSLASSLTALEAARAAGGAAVAYWDGEAKLDR